MDEKLIKEIIDYVEGMAEQLDAEYGANRKFEEIIKDDYERIIPDFYFKLKEIDE